MNLLKISRVIRGLTQMQLSEVTGISQAQLSRIEKGILSPKPEQREKLKAVFGMDFFEEKILKKDKE